MINLGLKQYIKVDKWK